MFFASDNSGPAHPEVIAALARANEGYAMAYGNDDLSRAVADRVREVFEAPEAAVHLVATGTAANSLILGTMARPFETVFCTDIAHVHEDECNAPEFYTGGAKLTLVPNADGKMPAGALDRAIAAEESRGVHGPQRGPVTITQATERGTVHTVEEIAAISEVAKGYGLKLHMDGARFANALVRLGCSPAEMTWKAGVDAVSFGGTKNGCLGVEAAVFFDPALSREFELRRKRGAHLFSKHRYLAAQMGAYLEGDRWLEMARAANAACDRLADGLRASNVAELAVEPGANMVFARMPRAVHRRLQGAGAAYHVWDGDASAGDPEEMLTARLVCDWSTPESAVDAFLDAVRG